MNNCCIIVFVGFSCIFLLGILIFKGLTARRLYKSFGVKSLIKDTCLHQYTNGIFTEYAMLNYPEQNFCELYQNTK
jgi:hypothetical protein